jgi:outer membrane protein OmpA-like peptidoglycan-associated protein
MKKIGLLVLIVVLGLGSLFVYHNRKLEQKNRKKPMVANNTRPKAPVAPIVPLPKELMNKIQSGTIGQTQVATQPQKIQLVATVTPTRVIPNQPQVVPVTTVKNQVKKEEKVVTPVAATETKSTSNKAEEKIQQKVSMKNSGNKKAVNLFSINFKFNSAELTAKAKRILHKNAKYLMSHKNVVVYAEGNTDSVGSDNYNKELGRLRAKAVRDFLGVLDVPWRRVIIVSNGKNKPLNSSQTTNESNRRTDFVLKNY